MSSSPPSQFPSFHSFMDLKKKKHISLEIISDRSFLKISHWNSHIPRVKCSSGSHGKSRSITAFFAFKFPTHSPFFCKPLFIIGYSPHLSFSSLPSFPSSLLPSFPHSHIPSLPVVSKQAKVSQQSDVKNRVEPLFPLD